MNNKALSATPSCCRNSGAKSCMVIEPNEY